MKFVAEFCNVQEIVAAMRRMKPRSEVGDVFWTVKVGDDPVRGELFDCWVEEKPNG